jgi:hypothetical protein
MRARLALCAAALAIAAIGGALLPALAQADNQIEKFIAEPSTTQAGGHPNIATEVKFGNRLTNPSPCNCSDGRAVTISLPTGVIGNPHAAPVCSLADFSKNQCAVGTQVGFAWLVVAEAITLRVPIYNMQPHPDEPALLAFFVPILNAPGTIEFAARTGSDFGLDVTSTGFWHLLPVDTVNVNLWGVPADPANDPIRAPFEFDGICQASEPNEPGCEPPVSSDAPLAPFTQNPTTCGVPLTATTDVLSYDGGVTHAEVPWPATTGCEQLAFNPSLTAQPTTNNSDSATGLEVDLRVPQTLSATVPSPSELKATTVTLPEGFSINPNAADGKTSCSDAQANFGTTRAAECPEISKVGTIEIDSSALPSELPGAIYLGEPQPGNKYRIFITGDGFGTHIKLPGTVRPDPQTGQLVVTFKDLPQTPLQGFDFHFFGSERGLLATPTHCGGYPVEAEFEPHDAALANQRSSSSFTITSGPGGAPCPGPARPFNPSLVAGTADNTAGTYSNLLLRVSRADGDQNMVGINVITPPGFSANVSDVPYCPESAFAALSAAGYAGLSELAAPACPAASQVGTMNATTGAGSHPLNSPGKVYLAGPYKGAPLSLIFVVPAVSGPYDLGNVIVRAAVLVNPKTAQITTISDPIPQILDGIPLRIRTLSFDFDRSRFTLNPTNCDPFSLTSQLIGNEGALAEPSAHFQVANCADLGFQPKLSLKLNGSSKRRGHPALHAVLKAKPGEANLARTVVAMPKALLLDNSHIGTVCTKVQFAADSCPADSVYGSASVKTPLLGQPLQGPVYLRSSSHKLPDLVADLRGQVDLELAARIDTTSSGALRANFESVPDAPVTKFVLSMKGGNKGLLVNSTSLCKGTQKASVQMAAQNGRSSNEKKKLKTACGSQTSRHKRHQRAGGVR